MAATTHMFGPINESRDTVFDAGSERNFLAEVDAATSSSPSWVSDLVYPHLTWSTLWFSLLCLFVAFNMKNLPFMWHMRIVNAFRHIIKTQRPRVPLKPSHLFQPLITSSQAQLMEIDFNLHKTNSSYFSDVDVARAHLVCTLFGEGIARMRGGTAAYTGSSQPVFGLALGAVTCNFRRELRPYDEYEMWTKILSWDEKWVYIVTHFVRKGAVMPRSYSLYPGQTEGTFEQHAAISGAAGATDVLTGDETTLTKRSVSGLSMMSTSSSRSSSSNRSTTSSIVGGAPENSKHLYATALSKCVFKSGRKTIAPELMFRLSGLLPSESDGMASDAGADKNSGHMTLEEVETERLRGLEAVKCLAAQNQQDLEAEFAGSDTEILGRHSDGSGFAPVVGTLFELATTRGAQIL